MATPDNSATVGLAESNVAVKFIPDKPIDQSIDLSMVLTAQIIGVLHDGRAHKEIAISALNAAISHVQCMDLVSRV